MESTRVGNPGAGVCFSGNDSRFSSGLVAIEQVCADSSERRLVRKNVEGGRREAGRTHSYECGYDMVPAMPG